LLAVIRNRGVLPEGVSALALAVGDNRTRQRLLRHLNGLSVPPLVHPSAQVSPSASAGRATVVFAGAVVNAGARLRDAVIVNSAAVVEHDCELADAVHLSPGAVLSGGVHVGERAWIGAGATVIQGITIGRDAMVGAGAVVIRDVPDDATVVGVPARQIAGGRSRRVEE
jgi:UDP-perosamine 4-acetyltransferase